MSCKVIYRIFVAAFFIFVFGGCDPLERHKVLSTVFDGVPSLPPPDQFCQEYAEAQVAAALADATGTGGEDESRLARVSRHEPYAEKRCNDCHDKTKEGGLVRPRNELCFICHTNFIRGPVVHGPVAVGACLDCHEPHSSKHPRLLKVDERTLCSTCHQEKRLAAGMHDMVTAKNLECVNCHDPHFGSAKYFLK